MAMLEVNHLEVHYGVIQALKGISFTVNQGEVIALIGANGAGKTTTLQTITGMLKPTAGEILFHGQDISKIPGHKIVPMGMAHVPEGRRVFAQLSVYENLKMGAYTRKDKKEIEESLQRVYKSFPRLEERKNQLECPSRRLFLWMKLPWACHLFLWMRFFILLKKYPQAEPRFFWWNRMPRKHLVLQIVRMYWKQVILFYPEMPKHL